jgi:RNA polymerase sigma-70 factor (ECF subfamily)
METGKGEVTQLLARLAAGDRSAEEALLPRVYAELHRIAKAHLRSERPGHTLQATALVHEVYIKLCGAAAVDWKDRAHFYRISARMMRRILTDYARQRNTVKRNSGRYPERLDDVILISDENLSLVIEIDELLEKLAESDSRLAQVVEMRFFAGLSEAEIGSALGVSERTVKRYWLRARAWLHEKLSRA